MHQQGIFKAVATQRATHRGLIPMAEWGAAGMGDAAAGVAMCFGWTQGQLLRLKTAAGILQQLK